MNLWVKSSRPPWPNRWPRSLPGFGLRFAFLGREQPRTRVCLGKAKRETVRAGGCFRVRREGAAALGQDEAGSGGEAEVARGAERALPSWGPARSDKRRDWRPRRCLPPPADRRTSWEFLRLLRFVEDALQGLVVAFPA